MPIALATNNTIEWVFLRKIFFASSASDLVLKEVLNLNKFEVEMLGFDWDSYRVLSNYVLTSQSKDNDSTGILEQQFIEIMSMRCHDNQDTKSKGYQFHKKIIIAMRVTYF